MKLHFPLFPIVLVFSFLSLLVPVSLYGAEVEEKTVEATEEQKTSLIQLYSWSTVLPKALIDLQGLLDGDKSIQKIDEELPGLIKEAEELRWNAGLAKTTPDIQLMELDRLQGEAHRVATRLEKISEPIARAIGELSRSRRDWQSKKSQIESFDNTDILNLGLAEEQLESLKKTVQEAFVLIEDRLTLALVLGKKIGDVQILLYSVENNLNELNRELLAVSIQQTSPSMLSADFYTRINRNLLQQAQANIVRSFHEQVEFFKNNLYFVLVGLLLLLFTALGLKKTREITPKNSLWYPFATCHFATAIFIGASLNTIIVLSDLHVDMLKNWQTLLHLLTMCAVIRLTTQLVHSKWQREVLVPLTSFTLITIGMIIVDLSQILILLYVFYVSLVALIVYFVRLPATRKLPKQEALIRRSLGILPAIVIVSGTLGYDQFAVMIFSTILLTVLATLSIWMLYMLHLGALDFMLLVVPINILSENREKIVARLKPLVATAHLMLFFCAQGVIWDLFATVNVALEMIFTKGFDLLGFHVTPGFFLTVIFVLYAAILASGGVQAILLQRVLPRYKAEKGVQISIARLVHYAILTIGFLIMLKVLGFQLNQLTLLGGALGVGIGFGLQAIVNNFASGLILLFERPIKVGDTIQVAAEFGEVKNMGLRATVIQTFDNAEIVIPNSDLITGQVTNWTLAERKVRIRIPVGVAYGTEVTKVLEILRGCATANPMVLSTPPPSAFFLAFGASSLDFELRVWIYDFLERTQVLSDLNQDIENEFALNDIEVPFPQTDLHLRSVDEQAGKRLGGSSKTG